MSVSDEEQQVVRLFECMSSVVRVRLSVIRLPLLTFYMCLSQALGTGFAPFGTDVLTRCFRITESSLMHLSVDPDSKREFLVRNACFVVVIYCGF